MKGGTSLAADPRGAIRDRLDAHHLHHHRLGGGQNVQRPGSQSVVVTVVTVAIEVNVVIAATAGIAVLPWLGWRAVVVERKA